MIIKIKSRKKPSFKQLLDYMLHDKDRLFDRNKRSFVIAHNLKANSIEEWEQQFKANELLRQNKRSDSVMLTHEIISFHRDDARNITLDKLEDMAREYINSRGPNGMYIVVPHFDKNHYHLHFCVSGIEYRTGKGLRLSKKDLGILKQKTQARQIEKYPELSKSVVNHGSPKALALSDKQYQYKQRTGRATDKEQVFGILETCYKQANSKADFFKKLKDCGLTPYMRGGKLTGVVHKNRKHRLCRLGFTPERLEELNKSLNKSKELESVRKKGKAKSQFRNR